jgi:hypothetical protein
MRKTGRVILPLAILLCCSISSYAQTKYRFEVFGAASFPQDKEFEITMPQSIVPIQAKHEISVGGRGGVRFGTDGKRYWGQEFSYSYGTHASKVINVTTGRDYAFTNHSHEFAYNALWYPGGFKSKSGITPYLTAGAGATVTTLSQKTISDAALVGLGDLKTDTSFAFNTGGGITFHVNGIYGFRVDARDYMSRPLRYGLPKSSDDPFAAVFPANGIFHQLEASFAFVYYFK